MKYLFHTINLAATGGSRVILDLSSLLIHHGHEVILILDNNKIIFDPPVNLKILHLSVFGLKDITPTKKKESNLVNIRSKNKKKNLRDKYPYLRSIQKWFKYFLKQVRNIPKYFYIRRFLKSYKPDLIATHNMYSNLEHFFFYKNYGLSVVLHNSPNEIYIHRDNKRLFPLSTYYKNLHCIGVAQAGVIELRQLLGSSICTSETIYNPININIREKALEVQDNIFTSSNYLICVCSLSKRKRVERVIQAFSKIKSKDLELLILGEGPERQFLENEIKRLGLTKTVHLPGFIANPYPYIEKADCFILASDSEGLPVVLVESLYLNTPVVSTDCPTGPAELLVDELSSNLISLEQTEDAITSQIAEKTIHAINYKLQDYSKYYQKFLPEKIVKKWEYLAMNKDVHA